MFDFSNYSAKSNYCDDSNKLVVGEIKDETAGVGIEEFIGLKPNMYSFLVDDNSEHKKAKRGNRNADVTILAMVNTRMFCWIRNVWGI